MQENMAKSVQYIRELFDSFFLHDGHMGSGSSFLLPSAGVESTDREEPPPALKNVNLTGIRFFILWTRRLDDTRPLMNNSHTRWDVVGFRHDMLSAA